MTALAHSLPTGTSRNSLTRFGRVFGSVALGLAKSWRHRRDIRRLSDLDDRMLLDIGLTRSEVLGALAEPFYDRNAMVLVRWDEERIPPPVRRALRRRAPAFGLAAAT